MKTKRIFAIAILTLLTLTSAIPATATTVDVATETNMRYEYAKIKSVACIDSVPSVHFVDNKGNEYIYNGSFYLEANNWDNVIIELVLDDNNEIVDWYYWN